MILVLGATGFVGKRVCKKLEQKGLDFMSTSFSLGTDLRDYNATLALFESVKPTYVLQCASFVGGIQWGMKRSAEIFDNNARIIANIYKASHFVGVKRIVNPISNCVYPAQATLFKEDEIWNGALHETVEIYGMLRKMSWAGAKAYSNQYGMDIINLVLSNMYGPEDHFEEERSHALGALIMKMVKAKQGNQSEVIVWGTGTPVREWLHVDDGAEAIIRGMNMQSTTEFVNIGVADGISIINMAEKIKEIVGYEGRLTLDTAKPDGAPYKTVDGSKGETLMNWKPQIDFDSGVKMTVEWYLKD